MFAHGTKEIWKNYNFPHPTSFLTRMPIKQDCYEYNDCSHSENQPTTTSSTPVSQNSEQFYSTRIESQCLHTRTSQVGSQTNSSNAPANPVSQGEQSTNTGNSNSQSSYHSGSNRFFVNPSLAARREANRLNQRRRLANETPERRQARLEAQRIQQQLRIASENPEQRAARLLALRERQKFRIAHESSEQRAIRLAALRHRQRLRLASETPEQRSRRLEALRLRQRQRIANETPEQRLKRLADLRHRQRLRLANEPADKRAHRLETLRIRQQQRLASESAEQRLARLAAARIRQQQRLANETREERAARFACIKRRRRSSCSSASTCPSIYIPRKPPPSPPTSPPTPPPPPPPTPFHTPPPPSPFHTPPSPGQLLRQPQRQQIRRPGNVDAASATDYWWESHFLVPAIQHQQPPPSHQTQGQGPPAPPGPRTPADFVNPVHIAWDSMYALCTNNTDGNLANHSAAIFAPFCNIRRTLQHNQAAAALPLPALPPPQNQEESHTNSPNSRT